MSKITLKEKVSLPFVTLESYSGYVHAIFIGEKESIFLCSKDGCLATIEYIPSKYLDYDYLKISSDWCFKKIDKCYKRISALKFFNQNYHFFIGPEGWDDEEYLIKLYEFDDNLEAEFYSKHIKLTEEYPDMNLAFGRFMNDTYIECPYCANAIKTERFKGILVCDDCGKSFSIDKLEDH